MSIGHFFNKKEICPSCASASVFSFSHTADYTNKGKEHTNNQKLSEAKSIIEMFMDYRRSCCFGIDSHGTL
jgi:hypothetical protein